MIERWSSGDTHGSVIRNWRLRFWRVQVQVTLMRHCGPLSPDRWVLQPHLIYDRKGGRGVVTMPTERSRDSADVPCGFCGQMTWPGLKVGDNWCCDECEFDRDDTLSVVVVLADGVHEN